MSQIDVDLEFIKTIREQDDEAIRRTYYERFESLASRVQADAERMGLPSSRLRDRDRLAFHQRTMEQFLAELREEDRKYSRFNWQQRWRASLKEAVTVGPGKTTRHSLRERLRVIAQEIAYTIATERSEWASDRR